MSVSVESKYKEHSYCIVNIVCVSSFSICHTLPVYLLQSRKCLRTDLGYKLKGTRTIGGQGNTSTPVESRGEATIAVSYTHLTLPTIYSV